jgi:xylulose-5-phosphate/fructose-6-phosphate phosphoketolase
VSRACGWSSGGGDLAQDFRRRRAALLDQSYRDGKDPQEITGWRWSS